VNGLIQGVLFKFLAPSLSHLEAACLDVDELRNRRVEYLEFAREFTWLLEEEDKDAMYYSVLNLLNLHLH